MVEIGPVIVRLSRGRPLSGARVERAAITSHHLIDPLDQQDALRHGVS
jgi:hypothetical protein